MSEFSRSDIKEVKLQFAENYRNIKPGKEMTPKERDEAVKSEFSKAVEEAKAESSENTRHEYFPQNGGDAIENDNEGIETDSPQEINGGSYRDVKKASDGETHEVHHMPADCASNLERDDGPAIKMEKADHRQTASCGSSLEAREYLKRQKELIAQGKFREALQMDIDDIREKFDDKYDGAIAEMLEYVDRLEKEGKING